MKIFKEKAVEYRLTKTKSHFNKAKITSSADARVFALQLWGPDIEIYESFFLLLLNRANNVSGWVKISQGGISGTVVDTTLVAKYAIDSLASSVIMLHNHPSGQRRPSQEDIKLTGKIKAGLAYFDIKLLDHVILCPDGDKVNYFSFADDGMI